MEVLILFSIDKHVCFTLVSGNAYILSNLHAISYFKAIIFVYYQLSCLYGCLHVQIPGAWKTL